MLGILCLTLSLTLEHPHLSFELILGHMDPGGRDIKWDQLILDKSKERVQRSPRLALNDAGVISRSVRAVNSVSFPSWV